MLVISYSCAAAAQRQTQTQTQQQKQLQAQTQTLDITKLSEPEIAQLIQEIMQDPTFQELLQDPVYMQLIASKQFQELLKDPKFLAQFKVELKKRHDLKNAAPQSNTALTTNTDATDTTTNAAEVPQTKLAAAHRICPLCGDASTNCPADQDRIKHGEVLPCGCGCGTAHL